MFTYDVFELIFVVLTKNETFDVKGNVALLEIAEDEVLTIVTQRESHRAIPSMNDQDDYGSEKQEYYNPFIAPSPPPLQNSKLSLEDSH